ncbi:MAG: CoA transferase [Chloroflexi bacterium]|nr:CoA transferase [Chloroflexota bacterium]MBI3930702.1 CoA transferase [Chloroflexota bacterium]
MAGILEGLKVVDMGVAIAMPAAAAMMADWGADVTKIEPVFGEGQPGRDDAYVYNAIIHNRNKKSLAIDLKQPAGIQLLHKFVAKADVFLSNYEVSTLKKLKADYATLSQINPGLIYCVLTAYGTAGPDKDNRGYDFSAAWARAGAQYQIGEPGTIPAMNLNGFMDRVTAAHAAAGILGALLHREKTGEGQELELSLYHVGVWTLAGDIQAALMGIVAPKFERGKTGMGGNPLWNSYRAKDGGWFQLATQGGLFWADFCRGIGRPDLENDPRFSGGMAALRQNHEELIRILDEVFAAKTMDEWEKRFREHNIIYGRVVTPLEVTTDPQAVANGFFAEVDDPTRGKIKLVTMPIKFHQNPASVRTSAPEKGQDTEETLLDLGYSWEDIGQLKEQGVVL